MTEQNGTVLEGIDSFDFSSLKKQRVAIIANHTSCNRSGIHLPQLLLRAGIRPVRIFSLEHGYFPMAQDMESVSETLRILDIPLTSLYGTDRDSLEPDPGQLNDIDTVMYDVRDVGSRYYTYLSTLFLFMEHCEHHGISLVVLDRVNPVNGHDVEGAVLEPKYHSFVGLAPTPQRHGLTSGEAARMYYDISGFSFPLHVEALHNWQRDMYADDTDLPWIPLSPNMPTVDTALLYPGGCLVEGTQLSEGRGTATPFHVIGHPATDAFTLAESLHAADLDGVSFLPFEFRPMFQKHRMNRCGGVYMTITDRHTFRPFRTFIAVLYAFRTLIDDGTFFRTAPYEFVKDIPAIELLLGNRTLIDMFMKQAPLDELNTVLTAEENLFRNHRRQWLLY